MKKYANLMQTAAHCGVSVTTLRYYITRYPDFPIFQKNLGRDGWKIDLAEVDRWRAKTGYMLSKGFHKPDSAKHQFIEHQTALLRLKIDKKKNGLLDRKQVEKENREQFAILVRFMRGLPEQISKTMCLPPEAIIVMRDEIEMALREFAFSLRGLMAKNDAANILIRTYPSVTSQN